VGLWELKFLDSKPRIGSIGCCLLLSSFLHVTVKLLIFQMNPSDDDDISESFNDQIKQHEDNIDFLNSQSNRLTDTVLDLQGN
jgi:hypothetical protein